MKHFFLTKLGKTINRALKLDPASAHRLLSLQGKSLSIELLPLHFKFQCQFHPAGVDLLQDDTLSCSAHITGTPLQMLGVVINKNERQKFFSDDITIQGDASFAQAVIALFDELQIDWEKQLAHFIGDIPSHYSSRAIHSFKKYIRYLNKEFTLDVKEYVQEEALLLPSRLAVEGLLHDIDVLRMDADRVAARLELLQLNLEDEA